MKRTIFRGAGVAIATPMFADGSIHYEELARLIDWQIENVVKDGCCYKRHHIRLGCRQRLGD